MAKKHLLLCFGWLQISKSASNLPSNEMKLRWELPQEKLVTASFSSGGSHRHFIALKEGKLEALLDKKVHYRLDKSNFFISHSNFDKNPKGQT